MMYVPLDICDPFVDPHVIEVGLRYCDGGYCRVHVVLSNGSPAELSEPDPNCCRFTDAEIGERVSAIRRRGIAVHDRTPEPDWANR